MTTVSDPSLLALAESSNNHGPANVNIFFFKLLLLRARLYNLQNEQFTFECLLSISLSILASDEMMQTREVNNCVDFSLACPMVMFEGRCSSHGTVFSVFLMLTSRPSIHEASPKKDVMHSKTCSLWAMRIVFFVKIRSQITLS